MSVPVYEGSLKGIPVTDARARFSIKRNILVDHWHRMPDVVDLLVDDPRPRLVPTDFSPGFAVPQLSDELVAFLAPATARWVPLSPYRGRDLILLDLTSNPGTHTTKTFASLVIVARALEFIRRTGTGVLLVSPTSGNKGIALCDAVLRSYDCGFATPEQLRVAVLAPRAGLSKLRASRLTTDPEYRRLNPLMVYDGTASEDVKQLARDFVRSHGAEVYQRCGLYPWFTLDLVNYLVADTARAFFELDVSPPSARRVHAHAVSSAFGLLGYHEGRRLLERSGLADVKDRPASLLVQHLATPDMVLYLCTGDYSRAGLPRYQPDGSGLLRQDLSPYFPAATLDVGEVIDPTFYTHRPPTSPAMKAVIAAHGGSGLVVSSHECLERYPQIRDLLSGLGRDLPDDPRALREWSVVMALTGTLNALDRGLLGDAAEVVVHGSGWYSDGDFAPAGDEGVVLVNDVEDVRKAVLG